jgi:hypothetical protein
MAPAPKRIGRCADHPALQPKSLVNNRLYRPTHNDNSTLNHSESFPRILCVHAQFNLFAYATQVDGESKC